MHQFSDVKQLRDIAGRLDPYNLFWIEDPFAQDNPVQLAELRGSIRCRLAGGAPLLSRHDWLPLLQAGALDVLMPDVKWLGGINQVQKVAAMGEVFGVQVSPHNASGPVASAASLHLSLSIANFIILEYPWGVPTWRDALCRNTETLAGGYFMPPNVPGLGVELDSVIAAEHRQPQPADSRAFGIRLPLH
jgi:galactonate dehydratase